MRLENGKSFQGRRASLHKQPAIPKFIADCEKYTKHLSDYSWISFVKLEIFLKDLSIFRASCSFM